MITPRRTRLVRVPDLHAFRSVISALAAPASADASSNTVVVVPTRGAARQLARLTPSVRAVTRDELYDELHARLADPPRRLTPLERDVVAQAAARAAAERHPDLAFRLRPGLVAEALRFYDQLRRQSQHVDRFEALLAEALGAEDVDRAAARMRVQTAFLADVFREYQAKAAGLGLDEHALRDRLIAEPSRNPVRHIVISVPDWIADAQGLYVADFDLLTRVPGLERLDVVATDRVLASGFHERLHTWLPGIDEETAKALGVDTSGFSRPIVLTPPRTESRAGQERRTADADDPWWTLRDREEELVAVARRLDDDTRRGESVAVERTAVVYKHPLPYLYAAAGVLRSARIPYQSADALPLAAEPTAAAIDLILDAAASSFTRPALVALLGSPHFVFAEQPELTRQSIGALDRFLSRSRYLGDPERLEALAAAAGDNIAMRPALDRARAIVRDLATLTEPHPASEHLQRVLVFWQRHLAPLGDGDRFGARERRARAAIGEMLAALAAVHAAHDDPLWTIAELGIAIRRRIEEHTFVPDDTDTGIHLLDDRAARYGDFDDVAIVGLTDGDWPERPRRNIFYPPSLLKSLGWPSEKDRRAAADAHFGDLVTSASRRTIVSTITLEDDALVSRSLQLDEIARAGLSTMAASPSAARRIFADERLSIDPVEIDGLSGAGRAWAEARLGRTPGDAPDYHGTVRGIAARPWSVSAIETYLDCPFKFFAKHVLKLEDEPEDEEVMDPRRQGQFVHEVFERFFDEWQASGRRAITSANLDEARSLFAVVVDSALQALPEGEAGLERTRLLGSPAAAGLGEAVFRMEAERPVPVVERLLEKRLDGEFTFDTDDGPRRVSLRGKADRIDLLSDGTFRLIDYKLGWPPQRTRALQLPIYSVCAERHLASYRGRRWTLGEAAYLAFKGPRRVVPLCAPADRDKVLADARQRLVATLDAIDRGEFPPTPDDVWRCDTCSYGSVCRKDYVGDV